MKFKLAFILKIIVIYLFGILPGYSSEIYSLNSFLSNPILEKVLKEESSSDSKENSVKDENSSEEENLVKKMDVNNINLDTKVMYGQYNNILSFFSLTHNQADLIYQLNSEFKRSNDFGYKNSSYHESEIGFSGKLNLTNLWEFMPSFEVKDQSYGMFDQSIYSREEKEKIIINLKNEYKPTPSSWSVNLGGAQYTHRLVSKEKISDSIDSDFNKINFELARDYIWSASNKLGFKVEGDQYFYSDNSIGNVDNDANLKNELSFGFSFSEFLKLGISPTLAWNKDYAKNRGWFPGGRLSLSSVSSKNTFFEISYNYNLHSFQPENFNFNQKYVDPTYDLPPAESHFLNLKGEMSFNLKDNNFLPIKRIKLKGCGAVEDNNNFYNYRVRDDQENILGAETVSILKYNGRADLLVDLKILNQDKFKLKVNYEYSRFVADKNITYQPMHTWGGLLSYSEPRWQLEWENKVTDEVYTDPDQDKKLNNSIIGSLGLQLKTYREFFIYAKVNNLYNKNYSFREGYPEPGRTILGGMRIII